MGTYWAFVGITAGFGFYYLASVFVALPEWLAPRRFPAAIGLLCIFFPDSWALTARRVIMALICFFCAAAFAWQVLRLR
jgi:hypothetical protein